MIQQHISIIPSFDQSYRFITLSYVKVLEIYCIFAIRIKQIAISEYANQDGVSRLLVQQYLLIKTPTYFQFSYNILMKLSTNILNICRFSNTSQAFQDFIATPKPQFIFKKQAGRFSIGSEIHVPPLPLSRQYVQDFFHSKDIKNKAVLINVDPSHLIGIKRNLALQYMNTNIYKGQSEPLDVLTKRNPASFIQMDELMFDCNIFAITDPLFQQKAKSSSNNQDLLEEIFNYYNSHLERGVQRLFTEYKVPKQYLYIIETAFNLDNSIYFCGINAYQLRQILTSYLSLKEIKGLFMESLRYSLDKKQINTQFFHHDCNQYLWKSHYSFLQPINYQLIKKIRTNIKGYCFAHPYNFITPQNIDINFKQMKDKQPDNSKLQKNAILEVLLGKLWAQPYTNNPFPYLSQSFFEMSADDKKLVTSLYNQFYAKYKAAKLKFGQQMH